MVLTQLSGSPGLDASAKLFEDAVGTVGVQALVDLVDVLQVIEVLLDAPSPHLLFLVLGVFFLLLLLYVGLYW